MDQNVKIHEAIALPVKELGNVQDRAFNEIDRHNQQLLDQSAETRRLYFSKLDTSSMEKFQASIETYRKKFASEVIGQFDDDLVPANPRTRLINGCSMKSNEPAFTVSGHPNAFVLISQSIDDC